VIAVAAWLLLIEGLAWAWFSLMWPLLADWPDRGFGLSKAGGVVLLATLVWLGAWMGLPTMSGWACWLLAVLVAAAATRSAYRHRMALSDFLRPGGGWLTAEAIWIGALAVFLLLRSADPAIAGGEKFMDFGLLNSTVRATTLPPTDPWLSGFPVNYYYFGYVVWATLVKMLGVDTTVAYNLALASIPAGVATAAFSIGFLLTRRSGVALVASLAMVTLGNLAGAAGLLTGGPYDLWGLTRVIPGTINEFPFFSFYWGDLHPHLLAMPALVLCAGLLLAWLQAPSTGRPRLVLAAAAGACAGVAVTTSIWEAAPMALLAVATAVFRASRAGARAAAAETAIGVVAAAVIALPALSALDTQQVNLGRAVGSSPLGAFLLVQAGWMLPSTLLLLVSLRGSATGRMRTLAALSGAGLAAGFVAGSVTVGLLAGLTLACWVAGAAGSVDRRFAWTVSAAAMTLLLVAELVFVDDIYGTDLERMNVVFKLHLQACLLFGLSWASCWIGLREVARRVPRFTVTTMLVVAALLSSVYPAVAVARRLVRAEAWTLDGAAHLEREHPGDRALIAFLNRHVTGQPTIVEAVSDPYSYSGRVSSYTGLPAVLGWANHERLWRRGPAAAAEIDRRAEAVRLIYEGNAADAARALADLAAAYVVVGQYERQTYPSGDFEKFVDLGTKVFDVAGTRLFEIRGEAGAR